MTHSAPNLNALWARLAVEELVRNRVDTFCLSPGSRCAPLTVAVAEHPNAKHYIHFDERGTAFHALGIAKATQNPVVLICTSGTAGANYFPAVAEAAQSRVPLIVITADRPPELHHTGANQTMSQTGLFGSFARWSCTIPCANPRIPPEFVLSTIDQAVHRATTPPTGPVHLDWQFREPLAPAEVDDIPGEYAKSLERWTENDEPYTRYTNAPSKIDEATTKHVAEILNNTKRGLLVVGQLHAQAERDAVEAFSTMLRWPVVADITSGLRLGRRDAPILHYFDQSLLSGKFRNELTDLTVFQIGAPIVSRRFLEFVESASLNDYVFLAHHPLRYDPARRITLRLQGDIPATLETLDSQISPSTRGEWCNNLQSISAKLGKTLDEFLQKEPRLNEIAVARALTRSLPRDAVLFLGNSMPVRDADMYGAHDGAGPWVAANRGVSGIDGNIATAAGYANALQRPVVALLGDLALLHDLNSLALVANINTPFVLIVLNNGGGGIFSMLPIAQHTQHFEEFFGTPHGHTFQHAAAMFSLDYATPKDLPQFQTTLSNAGASAQPTLIEINTNRAQNTELHKRLQDRLRDSI